MPRGLRNLSVADVRSLTVARLRQELTARGLSSDGLKQELVNRLEAALEAAPQPVTDAARDREPLAPRHDESELRATILSVLTDTLPTLLAASRADNEIVTAVSHVTSPPDPTPATLPPAQAAQLATSPTPLPRRMTDRILSGEFINLSDLLPNVISSGILTTRPTMQLEVGEGGMRVVEGTCQPRGRHVHDLSTWLEAYTVYMQVMLQAAPHRTHELLGYQSLIIKANRRFQPAAWLNYDRSFCQFAAANPLSKWDNIEANLWQLATTGLARPACAACQTPHPPTPAGGCPFRAFRQSSSPHASGAGGATFQGRPICQNYNYHRCTGNCFRAHVCLQCNARHPATRCTTTSKADATNRPAKSSGQ